MDIEERAEKWAREHIEEQRIRHYGGSAGVDEVVRPALIAAYLAGSAQTQADYVKQISAICDRHCLH